MCHIKYDGNFLLTPAAPCVSWCNAKAIIEHHFSAAAPNLPAARAPGHLSLQHA
jgi:hypothetical protein